MFYVRFGATTKQKSTVQIKTKSKNKGTTCHYRKYHHKGRVRENERNK